VKFTHSILSIVPQYVLCGYPEQPLDKLCLSDYVALCHPFDLCLRIIFMALISGDRPQLHRPSRNEGVAELLLAR